MTDDADSDQDEQELFARSRCDAFYRPDSIGSYFSVRLAVLASLAQHREQLVEWFSEGVEFHQVGVQIPSAEGKLLDADGDPPEIDALQRYIQIETVSLLHHAIETLLNLYTGLQDANDWLHPLIAMTDRTRHLPDLVAAAVFEPRVEEMRDSIAYLCLGRAGADGASERELEIIDNTARIVKVLADKWNTARNAYNAIKHGLLVFPSNASFAISDADGEFHDLGFGPSIKFLTHTSWENDERRWSLETQWIRPSEASKMITVAIELIESMWLVAVTRWSLNTEQSFRYRFVDPDKITAQDLVGGEGDPSGLKLHWGVYTEVRQPRVHS